MGTVWEPGSLNLSKQVVVKTEKKELVILQDPNTNPIGSVVWEVSIVFSRLLDAKVLFDVAGRNVLELGAGCGVAGMACLLHGAASVVFTDLPELVPHVKENVLRNLGKRHEPYDWTAVPLDWTKDIELTGKFDFVLATDCVYHDHLVQPLVRTLRSVCSPTTTLCLVYERRDPTVLSTFESLLKNAFKVKRPFNTEKLRALVGDDIMLRHKFDPMKADEEGHEEEEDATWLTVATCRRKKADYNSHNRV